MKDFECENIVETSIGETKANTNENAKKIKKMNLFAECFNSIGENLIRFGSFSSTFDNFFFFDSESQMFQLPIEIRRKKK